MGDLGVDLVDGSDLILAGRPHVRGDLHLRGHLALGDQALSHHGNGSEHDLPTLLSLTRAGHVEAVDLHAVQHFHENRLDHVVLKHHRYLEGQSLPPAQCREGLGEYLFNRVAVAVLLPVARNLVAPHPQLVAIGKLDLAPLLRALLRRGRDGEVQLSLLGGQHLLQLLLVGEGGLFEFSDLVEDELRPLGCAVTTLPYLVRDLLAQSGSLRGRAARGALVSRLELVPRLLRLLEVCVERVVLLGPFVLEGLESFLLSLFQGLFLVRSSFGTFGRVLHVSNDALLRGLAGPAVDLHLHVLPEPDLFNAVGRVDVGARVDLEGALHQAVEADDLLLRCRRHLGLHALQVLVQFLPEEELRPAENRPAVVG
mmetsp:Transcript_1349/g.3085  ORF Transcript_1349/g.3085 Transcript_1349/m.3085 type:complete len:369 (+) Transcript_1349:3760-4866(+)